MTWLHNPELSTRASHLPEAVRELRLPDGPGYVYVAGEGAVTRSIRSHLRQERNLPRHACTAVAYW